MKRNGTWQQQWSKITGRPVEVVDDREIRLRFFEAGCGRQVPVGDRCKEAKYLVSLLSKSPCGRRETMTQSQTRY